MVRVEVEIVGGVPRKARVTDEQTGETWTTGTTVNLAWDARWQFRPRLRLEIDSPHIEPTRDVTIILHMEEDGEQPGRTAGNDQPTQGATD